MSRLEPPVYLDPNPSASGNLVRLSDGRVFADVDEALPEDQVEQIRVGYRCVICKEPQQQAWPELCDFGLNTVGQRLCGFPIRRLQAETFELLYGGEVQIGSRINLADEQARLEEMTEFEERTGIVLPASVKFPDGKV